MQTIPTFLKPIAGATAAALSILVMTGCMTSGSSGRSTGQKLDDHQTASRVKSALDHAPVYKFTDVKVASYRGVVQLSGFVDTDEQKQQAGQIARRVDYVRDVANNITIKTPEYPSATGQAGGERTLYNSSTAPAGTTTTIITTTTSTNATDRATSTNATDRATTPKGNSNQ